MLKIVEILFKQLSKISKFFKIKTANAVFIFAKKTRKIKSWVWQLDGKNSLLLSINMQKYPDLRVFLLKILIFDIFKLSFCKKKKKNAWFKIKLCYNKTHLRIINKFDIELRRIRYVFWCDKIRYCEFSIIFLNMMVCLKFNRLEIYKFRAFSYCSFKTSYIFLGSI